MPIVHICLQCSRVIVFGGHVAGFAYSGLEYRIFEDVTTLRCFRMSALCGGSCIKCFVTVMLALKGWDFGAETSVVAAL